MKTYCLTIKWNDRRLGPMFNTHRLNCTNPYVALYRGVRAWLKTKDSKTRRDARKEMTVTVRCIGNAIGLVKEEVVAQTSSGEARAKEALSRMNQRLNSFMRKNLK